MEQQIPRTHTSLRRALAVWIYYVIAPHKGLKLEKRDIQDLTEVKDMLATRFKKWEQEFTEKGLEKGREEGRQEGMQKGIDDFELINYQSHTATKAPVAV
ncbi:MAG: hypothetical protein GXP08_01580 [Gammaproteobacteria bacterium]|nr:hypothetical protein [Gammaproteobacteria bacterium]